MNQQGRSSPTTTSEIHVLVVGPSSSSVCLPLWRILQATSTQKGGTVRLTHVQTAVDDTRYSSYSRFAPQCCVTLPNPNLHYEGFRSGLISLIECKKHTPNETNHTERVVILLPTTSGPDVVHLARAVAGRNACNQSNVPSVLMHTLLSCPDQLQRLYDPVAFQREWRTAAGRVENGEPVTEQPEASKLLQQPIKGTRLFTYSFLLQGRVIAHVCFGPPRFFDQTGSRPPTGNALRCRATAAQWERSFQLVQRVTSHWKLDSGHFGLELVERFNGELVPVGMCNNNIGLAALSPRFNQMAAHVVRDAILFGQLEHGAEQVVSPLSHPKYLMTSIPAVRSTVLYCLNAAAAGCKLSVLTRATELAMQAHDDIWWWKDPVPYLVLVVRFVLSCMADAFRMVLQVPTIMTDTSEVRYNSTENQEGAFESIEQQSVSTASPQVDKEHDSDKGLRILVTGATGFLGGRLVKVLSEGRFKDDENVELPFDLGQVTLVTATGRNEQRGQALIESLSKSPGSTNNKATTRFVSADLSNAKETFALVQDHNVIFHCAALCEPWGPWEDFIASNVTATQNLVQAGQMVGVKLFVHISSPSVCFGVDTGDRTNVKEDEPLPPLDAQPTRYSATKMIAEEVVLDVARSSEMGVVILRPRGIFGPGDTTLFPRLVDRIRKGRLRRILGDGRTLGQFTYVDNLVFACLCCLNHAPKVAKIYNITDGQPQQIWGVIRVICERLNLKHPTERIPHRVVYIVGYILEICCTVALLFGINMEPLVMRYTVNLLSRSTTFDIGAAREELGYRPIVTTDEGLERFLARQMKERPSVQ